MKMDFFVRVKNKIDRTYEERRLKSLVFAKKIGGGVKIGLFNRFIFPENIYLDDFVHLGERNHLYAQAEIHIGSGTVLADDIIIRTANHYYDGEDLRMLPYDERVICKPVVIGRNVWIGGNVIILPGVTIGDGAVIGAGSVIRKSVPCCAIVIGNPAEIVKYRNREIYDKLDADGKQIMKQYDTYRRENILVDKNNSIKDEIG